MATNHVTGGGDLILVVDDDLKIAELVRSYLLRAGYRVAIAQDGLAALTMIRDLEPVLVVLDLMLPKVDGGTVARAAREESECSIIMLSALGSTAQRVSGLELGADDYLPKPFAPSELVARIRSVLRRTRPHRQASVLRHGDLVLDAGRRVASRGGRAVDLTGSEFDLLSALMRARGRVLSRGQLLDAVARTDGDPGIRDRSIDVYVRRLRGKLGDDGRRPTCIVTVRGIGYQLAPA